jgi:predicted amidohydrolase YtcJ
MRVNGVWLRGEDGVNRPIVPGLVQLANSQWLEVSFLLDAGAGRSVFSSDFFSLLHPLEKAEAEEILPSGVGGAADSITVHTAIAFVTDGGRSVTVRGTFGVFAKGESADISILEGDVTNNFSVIYDYPQQIIALLAPPHSYDIKPALIFDL